jgi:phenylacetate-CoA ligase
LEKRRKDLLDQYVFQKNMPLKSIYYLGKMWRNQRKPYEKIEKLQLNRLRAIVRHAYNNSPFYHDKFKKATVYPDDIASLKDISRIPFTTKEELREAGETVLAKNISPQKCYSLTTSGSTGKKLEIIHSDSFKSWVRAFFYRIYLAWGMRPFKRLTYIRYDPTERNLAEKLGIARSHYISTFLDAEKQLDLILKQTPHVLVGHPPDLVALAKVVRAGDKTPQFDFIGSNSELLTQIEREFIEKTFQCPVHDEYSSLEVGYIARTCKKKKMHLISDSVFTEFIKDYEPVSPGEQGEVAVTLLTEDATPFIRYRLGDVASLFDGECDCGITFPVMNVIEGRTDDFIILPSGKEIPPTRVIPIFFRFESIREFNMIQVSSDKISVNLVPTEQFGEKEEEKLLDLLKNELPAMDIQIQYMDTIEKTQRGKKRAVINLIKKS